MTRILRPRPVSSDRIVNTEQIIGAIGSLSIDDEPVSAAHLSPETLGDCGPLVHELVYSMLLWEASIDQAQRGMERLRDSFVDCNELRVCLPHEVAEVLGGRYPRLDDRCERLVGALRWVFSRNQSLTLEPIRELNKRDARNELLSVEAIPRFVASRILLIGLEAHAFPMDDKLAKSMHKADLVEHARDPDRISSELERDIRAGDALGVYTRLERWLIERDKQVSLERSQKRSRKSKTEGKS